MRHIVAVFALSFLLPPAANADELNVPFHRQNTMVWCWAAAIAMVGEYRTGQRAEDCQVLSAYDRLLGGPGTCCEYPLRCMRTGGTQEMKVILANIFGLSGYHHLRSLAYGEVKREIDNDRPFIAGLRSGFGGHVVVVTGYVEPDEIVILDPMFGRRQMSYRQLIGGFGGGWAETFTIGGASTSGQAPPATVPPPAALPPLVPFCCDAWGRRRCQINPTPVGAACGCLGQGMGIACY